MSDIDDNLAQREAIEIDRSKGDFKYEENYAFDAGIGLTPSTIDYIAKVKGEEEWIREFRLNPMAEIDDNLAIGFRRRRVRFSPNRSPFPRVRGRAPCRRCARCGRPT